MFKSIMIALADPVVDAAALKAAVRIARTSAARLHLVHVLVSRNGFVAAREEIDMLRASDWAAQELGESVSFRQLHRNVHTNPKEIVADALREYVADQQIDLIVMARRRHSLNRFLLGSVGQRLLFAQDAPILFIPQLEHALPTRGARIMLPLDGSSGAETVLDTALDLSRALKGSLSLLRVLQPMRQPAGVAGPGFDSVLAEEGTSAEDRAQDYLERLAAQAECVGVKTDWITISDLRVAPAVRRTAAARRVHIVALAPRRTNGSLSFADDSLTEALLHKGETALLLRRRPMN